MPRVPSPYQLPEHNSCVATRHSLGMKNAFVSAAVGGGGRISASRVASTGTRRELWVEMGEVGAVLKGRRWAWEFVKRKGAQDSSLPGNLLLLWKKRRGFPKNPFCLQERA